jgi:hypothetical protein
MLYILTRTSGRPKFFANLRESIKALTYPEKIVHIVHSDDPRNESYVEGDIIIKGEAHGDYMGKGPYNLYNNTLLKAIPGDGWVHFIDDDDKYTGPDVFKTMLTGAQRNVIQIGRVKRWGDTIFPDKWGKQKSYQSECFLVWARYAKTAKWWSEKGGDHYYSKQLTRKLPVRWVENVIIAEAQTGKGHGRKVDIDGEIDLDNALPPDKKVWVKVVQRKPRTRFQIARLYQMTYREARVLERHDCGVITYRGVTIT